MKKYTGASCAIICAIEDMIKNGSIEMPDEEMEPTDSEGHAYDAVCRYVGPGTDHGREWFVELFFMNEKSYERQAAEQIFEQTYNA